jgi:hypothetical protein
MSLGSESIRSCTSAASSLATRNVMRRAVRQAMLASS